MASHLWRVTALPTLHDLADAFAYAWCRIRRDDQNDPVRDYSPNDGRKFCNAVADVAVDDLVGRSRLIST
jgi:hypothetical protein